MPYLIPYFVSLNLLLKIRSYRFQPNNQYREHLQPVTDYVSGRPIQYLITTGASAISEAYKQIKLNHAAATAFCYVLSPLVVSRRHTKSTVNNWF